MPEDDQGSGRPLRSLGEWARRVGAIVAEVSETVTLPEGVRAALDKARHARIDGDINEAIAALESARTAQADPAYLDLAHGLVLAHELLQEVPRATASAEAHRAVAERLASASPRPAVSHLLDACRALTSEPERALDELRRAERGHERAPAGDLAELRLLEHLVGALAHSARGRRDRAIREVYKARAYLPPGSGARLRARLLSVAVDALLGEGRITDAEHFVRESHRARVPESDPSPNDEERAALVRIYAARGDAPGALALASPLPETETFESVRVDLALGVGSPRDTMALALAYLQRDPQSGPRLRRWALACVDGWHLDTAESAHLSVLEALDRALELAPPALHAAHARELAHVALRSNLCTPRVLEHARRALQEDRVAAGPECRLVDTLARIRGADTSVGTEFRGPATRPQFRLDPELGDAPGPDEISPLRDPARRIATVRASCRLADAERALQLGLRVAAEEALVAALVEQPSLLRARTLLGQLAQTEVGGRLEALLQAATTILAALPVDVLGVPLTVTRDALGDVIAARERLARPLAIAIMGEFSSGKSTFVNALLGESVAPMGVLPTTSTINVFRRGVGRGARVHYRDDHIETVRSDELDAYLDGIDATEAAKIRYVEIEREGGRMGDAVVVDTPGLNALDEFHEAVAREFLEEADAVVWIFSATRGGAATEVAMLSELRAGGRRVLGVLNKVDTLDAAERSELGDYLEEQLGEVLVEVVPLSATEALTWRTSKVRSGDDPFAVIDRALETHFLAQARELKSELTRRRFTEALERAKGDLESAAAALEERAGGIDDEAEFAAEADALREFAGQLHASLLDADDRLARELLALGVVSSGRGLVRSPDQQDAAYFDSVVESATMGCLRQALAELAGAHPDLVTLLAERLVPWARGHLAGRGLTGFGHELIRGCGPAAQDGEDALRLALRKALTPVADAWAGEARGLFRPLAYALSRTRRAHGAAPLAEALRLRSTVLPALDAFLERLDPRPG